MFASCRITHRPDFGSFYISATFRLKTFYFCGAVNNQGGQDDREEPTVLGLKFLYSFYSPSKVYSCSPRY